MKKLTIWIAIIPIMTGLSSCSKDDDYNYLQEDDRSRGQQSLESMNRLSPSCLVAKSK